MPWVEHVTLSLLHSPVAFISSVEIGATAAMEVALQFVPVARCCRVLSVLDELVGHRRRGDRAAVSHSRPQLERGEDGSKLFQR